MLNKFSINYQSIYILRIIHKKKDRRNVNSKPVMSREYLPTYNMVNLQYVVKARN